MLLMEQTVSVHLSKHNVVINQTQKTLHVCPKEQKWQLNHNHRAVEKPTGPDGNNL